MSQKPSIGRIVIYRMGDLALLRFQEVSGYSANIKREHPAIITSVDPSGLVNLMVMFDGALPRPMTKVAEGDPATAKHDIWHWPARD